jgi:TRAP-type C4-dicarboxylate transport system substrate-binding protein
MRNRWRGATLLRIAGLGAWAVLAILLGSNAAVAEDQKVTLRFSHWAPPNHPLSLTGVPEWVSAVEKASGGSIKIEVYPTEQLGKATDHYDMARDGVADITWVNAGLQPGRFPVAQAIEFPWLFGDPAGGTLAFDEWYRPYAAKEMKDVKVCLLHVLLPSELHSKREIKSVDDMKTLKIRTANATQARYMTSLGAVIVPVPAPGARDAIEKGVADSILFPWNSLITFGIDNVLSYHMDAPFSSNGFELVFNTASYDKLSPAQKKVIDDHCTPEWSARFTAGWNAAEFEGKAKLAAKPGHVVYPISAAFMGDLQKTVEPLRKTWADDIRKVGEDPDKVYNGLIESLKKYKAI